MKQYYVYWLTNRKRGVLYAGLTIGLGKRVFEHKHQLIQGFTSRYNLTNLVYSEETPDIISAIGREKRIKGRVGSKKIGIIESENPEWKDSTAE
jgi:putative endonuclease